MSYLRCNISQVSSPGRRPSFRSISVVSGTKSLLSLSCPRHSTSRRPPWPSHRPSWPSHGSSSWPTCGSSSRPSPCVPSSESRSRPQMDLLYTLIARWTPSPSLRRPTTTTTTTTVFPVFAVHWKKESPLRTSSPGSEDKTCKLISGLTRSASTISDRLQR